MSRKLISFREAFTSSRWALSLFLIAPGGSCTLLFAVDDGCCGVTQRSASHRIGLGRPFLQLATSSSLRPPRSARRRLGLRPSDASQPGPTPQPAAKKHASQLAPLSLVTSALPARQLPRRLSATTKRLYCLAVFLPTTRRVEASLEFARYCCGRGNAQQHA